MCENCSMFSYKYKGTSVSYGYFVSDLLFRGGFNPLRFWF